MAIRLDAAQAVAEDLVLALRRPHAAQQIEARRGGEERDADRDQVAGRNCVVRTSRRVESMRRRRSGKAAGEVHRRHVIARIGEMP